MNKSTKKPKKKKIHRRTKEEIQAALQAKLRAIWVKQPFAETTCTVNCVKKEEHKIYLSPRGRLALCSHPKDWIETIQALKSLGSNTRGGRCLTVKRHWVRVSTESRGGNANILPDELRIPVLAARKRHRSRRIRRWTAKLDHLSVTFHTRASVVAKLIKRLLERAYPKTDEVEGGLVKIRVAVRTKSRINEQQIKLWLPRLEGHQLIDEFHAEQQKRYKYSHVWPTNADINGDLDLNPNWYETIYKKGWAMVDGFIIRSVDDHPTSPKSKVIVGLYKPGFDKNMSTHREPILARSYCFYRASAKIEKNGTLTLEKIIG